MHHNTRSCGFATIDILHKNIVNVGKVPRSLLMIKGGDKESVLHHIELHIIEVDVGYFTTPVGIRLDVQTPLEITAGHTILHKHITYARSHFAANDNAMQALKLTIAYNDVFGGPCHAAPLVIASRLYGHIIVAIIENHLFDEHIARILRINAVVVFIVGIKTNAPHSNILTHQKV